MTIKNNTAIKKSCWFYIISSALLLSAAFSGYNLGILAWFSLAPFLLCLEKKSLLQRFKLCFVFAFCFFISTIYWLAHVSFFGLLMACLYLSLEFSVFALFFPSVSRPSTLIFGPLLWAVIERLRGIIFSGFGWSVLGYTQYKNIPLIQIAEVFGVWGLSFIIVMVNVVLAAFIYNKFQRPKNKLFILVPVIILLASYSFGFYSLNNPAFSPDIKVSLIQPNIPQEKKWDPDYTVPTLEHFSRLTKKAALANPDLIIWPETSVPGYILDDARLYSAVASLAKSTTTRLLVGAPREDYQKKEYYNSAFLFGSDGRLEQFHDKIHLVPFGEYVPYKNIFWFLANGPIADFSRGSRYTLFEVSSPGKKTVRFGVLVCFEDIFPSLVKQFRRQGADFLVTITNEAWFKKTREPIQHTAISVFRAVENRCWFLRCANTGISCFIDPYGRIRKKIEHNNEDIFVEGIAALDLSAQ